MPDHSTSSGKRPPPHRSQYLVNEPPIPLYPSLAVALDGAERALILQQLNYWLTRSENYRDGRYWVYNTYEEWRAQFPWMSVSTIRRVLAYLEERGLIITGNYNRQKTDRTKWYTVDDAALGRLLGALPSANVTVPSVQNDRRNIQSEQQDLSILDRSVPETTPESTPEDDIIPRKRSLEEIDQIMRAPRLGRR